MSAESDKKRKHDSQRKPAEENFVKVDTFRFLELHYHKLLYAETNTKEAEKCIKQGEEKPDGERVDRTALNLGAYVKRSMEEHAWGTKAELQRLLEDKPEFRGRFSEEVSKCDDLIVKLTGKRLEWKTTARRASLDDAETE